MRRHDAVSTGGLQALASRLPQASQRRENVASSLDSSVGAVDALVAALDGPEAVDPSPTLRSAMPRFFAHPEFHIIDDARLIERDQYRLQTLVLPEHVGPPAHVVAERPEATVDTLDVTA